MISLAFSNYPGIIRTFWRHFRPAAWEVVEVTPYASEFLGRAATVSLLSKGLLWPPALHLETAWLAPASGATVITGDGGDEFWALTGLRHQRVVLAALARARATFSRRSEDWPERPRHPEVVDAEVLRSFWLAERAHPGTTPLLQSAWLATTGASGHREVGVGRGRPLRGHSATQLVVATLV